MSSNGSSKGSAKLHNGEKGSGSKSLTLGAGARTRTCTDHGAEYFLSTALKNRNKLNKNIHKHVGKMDDLLKRGSLEDAKKLGDILSGDHEEFVRSHLRYQELSGNKVDLSDEKRLSDEVLKLIRDVQERLTVAIEAHHSSGEGNSKEERERQRQLIHPGNRRKDTSYSDSYK